MKTIKLVLYVLTIIGAIIFLWLKRDDLTHLSHVRFYNIIVLFVLSLLSVYFNGLLFNRSVKMYGISLSFGEWFGLAVSNTMYNYLLPARGGMALRAIYLKNKYGLAIAKYVSLTAALYLLNLATAALLICGSFFLLRFSNTAVNGNYLILSLGILLVILGLFLFPVRVKNRGIRATGKILDLPGMIFSSVDLLRRAPSLTFRLILLNVAFILVISLRLFFSYYALGIEVCFTNLLFINSLVTLSMVISLTPGNVGIKEGIIAFSAYTLGISAEDALLGAVLDRVVAIITVFAWGLLFSRRLLNDVD